MLPPTLLKLGGKKILSNPSIHSFTHTYFSPQPHFNLTHQTLTIKVISLSLQWDQIIFGIMKRVPVLKWKGNCLKTSGFLSQNVGSLEGERGELLKNNLASMFGFELNVLLHVVKKSSSYIQMANFLLILARVFNFTDDGAGSLIVFLFLTSFLILSF